MYSYQHRYHAGSFADLHKHLVLLGILTILRQKESSFCILDAFAGEGIYDLNSHESQKNKEYLQGYKTWFVYHILTEMALDRVMIKKFPLDLKEFYDDLKSVDLTTLAGFLIKCGKTSTDSFDNFYKRFTEAEYLFYYIRDDKFCYSLNRVLTRSKQPEMSRAFAADLSLLFPEIELFLEQELIKSGLL